MPGILLTVAYDGTDFSGWAYQKVGRTVADALNGAVLAVDAKAGPLRGTSRTDAGVHAEMQMVAFDASLEIAPRNWVLGINSHLPKDVAVRRAQYVPLDFNPRFRCNEKTYRYRLLTDRVRDPLHRHYAWRVPHPLDVQKMNEEAKSALGTHDFRAFRSSGDERTDTVRTLTQMDVIQSSDERGIDIVVTGDAFLYNMVRILVGTLVDVGRGKTEPGTIARALANGERGILGETAPAQGLTLERVVLALPSESGEAWP